MERWAADDLRSVNAQIEYVLRQALVKQGRVKLVEKVIVEVEDIEPPDGEENWAVWLTRQIDAVQLNRFWAGNFMI